MKKLHFWVLILLCLNALTSLAQQSSAFVKIETPQGTCIIKLYNETPVHRDNFIKLIKSHYFDKTTFNRILKGFVIQGGDPDSLYANGKILNSEQKWIVPELDNHLYHKRGALAMGRDDNAAKQSFTTQFYIVDGKKYTDFQLDEVVKKRGIPIPADQREVYRTIGGTPRLDHDYTVFGEIVKGIDLIDKITAVKVDKNGNPENPVWMKLTLLSAKQQQRN